MLCLLCVVALSLPAGERVRLTKRVNRAFLFPVLVVQDEVEGYFGLRGENARLLEQLERRSLEVAELEWTRVENLRLREALAFRERLPVQVVAAEIIASSDERPPRSFLINKGSRDGIQPNQPVVTPDGLVGKTAETDPSVTLVMTLRHPDFRASALAVTEADAETGIAVTNPAGELELIVPLRSTAGPGNAVVTSGLGPVFPRGIPIGKISDVAREDRLKLQKNDGIVPAVDLDRIAAVFVLVPGAPSGRPSPAGESTLFWPGFASPPVLAGALAPDSVAALEGRPPTP